MKSEHTETIQKAFIMQSRHFETHKANFTQKGLFDHVVSKVQPKKTDHVLEVAVGTCICGRVFAPFVHEVTCLDVTPAMLAVGKTQAEKQAYNNMMFVTDDAEKLPFLDYSFGKIVNISSMGGKIWTKFGGWYHATKFAVEGFSDCLRMELKPFGLDVVVVEPGGIKTDWGIIAAENLKKTSANGAYAEMANEAANGMIKNCSGSMLSKPELIAKTVRKAVTKRRPRTRYLIDFGAKPMVWTHKIFGDRMFDWVIKNFS